MHKGWYNLKSAHILGISTLFASFWRVLKLFSALVHLFWIPIPIFSLYSSFAAWSFWLQWTPRKNLFNLMLGFLDFKTRFANSKRVGKTLTIQIMHYFCLLHDIFLSRKFWKLFGKLGLVLICFRIFLIGFIFYFICIIIGLFHIYSIVLFY